MSRSASIAILCLTMAHASVGQGRIVVCGDEWPLSNAGFANNSQTAVFTANVAAWFTGGAPGSFLAYSNNFGLTQSSLAATMAANGHSWTVSTAVAFNPSTLSAYDGVFLAGGFGSGAGNTQTLVDYVLAGGCVYIAAGTGTGGAGAEAASWNGFLNVFGLNLLGNYAGSSGNQFVGAAHPALAGVSSLYFGNENPVTKLSPSDPAVLIAGGAKIGFYAPLFEAPPDVALLPSSWAVAPSSPLIGTSSALSVAVVNFGLNAATAQVAFYEGNPAAGGTLIGTDTDTVGFGVPKTFSTTWTPTVAGLRSLYAVVTNLSFTDAVTTNNQAQANVWVNAPVELLVVHQAEVTGWSGGTFETTFTVENAGSTAATISGFFSSSGWVSFPNLPTGQTLTPGQALQVTASVTIPAGTAGGVGVPETYPLGITALTATGGFYSGTLVARVFAAPPLTVTVTVVNATNNAPLAGATVAVDGSPATWSTNGAGQVAIPLPEGQRGFYAYKPGFIAGQEIATVSAAAPNVTIALDPGQTLEVQTIVSQPLTTQQIIDRGVVVQDPINNVVVDFVVALQIGPPLVLPNVEIPAAPPVNTVVTFGGPCVCAGGATGFISATFSYPAPNVRHETWIIIPGSVWALKEFRDATIVVRNNAVAAPPSAIRFENVTAAISLPSGLALPELNGAAQPLIQTLGTLNAGEQTQANWVIRGDVAGTYQLTGSATGDLWLGSPGAQGPTVTAAATSEPFTVELPQLRLAFTTPTSVVAGQPFDFEVHVTNEGQATAQLVRVSLKVDQLVNCSPDPSQPGAAAPPPPTPTVCAACNCSPCFSPAPQPTYFYYDAFSAVTRMEVEVGDIPPGQTGGARFRLISHVTGVVLQVQTQVWNSTTASPPVTAAQAYPGTPVSDPNGGCLMLSGVNVPFAGGDAGYLKVVPNAPGNTLALTVATTNPALLGNPYLLAIDAFTPNGAYDLPPVPYGLPGLWVGPNSVVVLDGSTQGYVLVPGGNHLLLPFPPGLSGFHLLLQAAVGAPGGFCATDAHEFVFE